MKNEMNYLDNETKLQYLDGACNSIALVNSLARLMTALRSETTGTAELNAHPMVQMYLHKLCDLAGIPTDLYGTHYARLKSQFYTDDKETK